MVGGDMLRREYQGVDPGCVRFPRYRTYPSLRRAECIWHNPQQRDLYSLRSWIGHLQGENCRRERRMFHITRNETGPGFQGDIDRQGRVTIFQNREWKFAGIADLLNVADIGEDIRVHGLCGITLAQDADDRRRVPLPRFNREETVARAHRRRRDRSIPSIVDEGNTRMQTRDAHR
jgi:hypothetical protein